MFHSRQATAARRVLFALILLCSASAPADPLLFGAIASDQAALTLSADRVIGIAFNQSWGTGGEEPVTSLTLQSQSFNPGVVTGEGTYYSFPHNTPVDVTVSMFGYSNASGYIAGGALHADVNASAPSESICVPSPDGGYFFAHTALPAHIRMKTG